MIDYYLLENINLVFHTTPIFRDMYVENEVGGKTTLSITYNNKILENKYDLCEILQLLTDEVVRIQEGLKR